MCKACNTRFGIGIRVCPSCGRRAATHASETTSSGSDSGSLSTNDSLESDADLDLELELSDDEVVIEEPKAEKPRKSRKSGSSAAARRSKPPKRADLVSGGQMTLDLDQVRSMLAEEPNLLEKGLSLYSDDDGEPFGVDFPTPVGNIDVLARDGKGHFVVVLVPKPNELSDSVSGMLQRMGWVRKHLTSKGEEVRGVVVSDHVPEELAYAAAGAGGSISFKSFRVSLTFHNLEL